MEGAQDLMELNQCTVGEDDCAFYSNCSTPFMSAPSSPGREDAPPPRNFLPSQPAGLFFSAPASPVHFAAGLSVQPDSPASGSSDFDFSARFPPSAAAGLMSSADELFVNGQIRPMRLSSHLQRPRALPPLVDVDVESGHDTGAGEDADFVSISRGRDTVQRSRSVHRKSRSLSPLRSPLFRWRVPDPDPSEEKTIVADAGLDLDPKEEQPVPAAASRSSSSSSTSSSSSSKSSKRWVFIKDFLHRSKSDGSRSRTAKDAAKFWHSISFSKPPLSTSIPAPPPPENKPVPVPSKPSASTPSGAAPRRRGPSRSAHERFYAANRAQAEEMRRRTFLPYRQGLLGGCLGFNYRSYGAINGLVRGFNAVSSS